MEQKKYSDMFALTLSKNVKTPNCRFCGSNDYAAVDSRAMLILDDASVIGKKVTIPSGVIICRKCGHIEFFALGVLNDALMPSKTSSSEIRNSEKATKTSDSEE